MEYRRTIKEYNKDFYRFLYDNQHNWIDTLEYLYFSKYDIGLFPYLTNKKSMFGLLYDANHSTLRISYEKESLDIQLDEEKSKQLFLEMFHSLSESHILMVIPIIIICNPSENHHANYLIINRETKQVERYEPNKMPIRQCYNQRNFDVKIVEFFHNLNWEIKYIPPIDFCPINLNIHDLMINKGQKGRCVIANFIYVCFRLSHPNIHRDRLIKIIIDLGTFYCGTFKEYADNVITILELFIMNIIEISKGDLQYSDEVKEFLDLMPDITKGNPIEILKKNLEKIDSPTRRPILSKLEKIHNHSEMAENVDNIFKQKIEQKTSRNSRSIF